MMATIDISMDDDPKRSGVENRVENSDLLISPVKFRDGLVRRLNEFI